MLENILKKFGYVSEKDIGEILESSSLTGKIAPVKNTSEYLKETKSWAWGCVTAIADRIAMTEFKLYKYKPNGDVEEVLEHPILNILYRVNNFTTKFDHLWLSTAYLEMAGEAPWYIERVGGEIVGMQLIRPDRLEINYGKKGKFLGYTYDIGNSFEHKKIPLEPNELIFIKYPSPVNQFRGVGTLQAVAKTVDIDTYSEEWNANFFHNSARPDTVVRVKAKKLTDQQRKTLKKGIEEYYKGKDNAHKTLLLAGDMEFEQIGFSQKDMDFMEQMKFDRDKIMGIFRVPKILLSQTDGVNYANARIAEMIFAKYTIKPKLQRIVEQLNEFFIPMFSDGEKLFLDFVDPVSEDVDEKIKKYESGLRSGYYTINEVRAEEGKTPLKGTVGDNIYIPSNLIAIGEAEKQKAGKRDDMVIKSFKARTKNDRRFDKARVEIRNMVREKMEKKVVIKEDPSYSLEEKRLFWDNYIKIADKQEKELKNITRKMFERQSKEVLKKIRQKAIDTTSAILDVDKEVVKETKKVAPLVELLIKEEGAIAMDIVTDAKFSMASREVIDYIKKRPKKYIKDATIETNRIIKDVILEGVAEGYGIDKIKKNIENKFIGFEGYRAERIARSEIIRAGNFATEEAYIQSGVVEKKEWLTSFDERTCEFCKGMNGKTVKLKEVFFEEGDSYTGLDGGKIKLDYEDVNHPPLHTSCRCTIIPVISEKGIKKDKYVQGLQDIIVEAEERLSLIKKKQVK